MSLTIRSLLSPTSTHDERGGTAAAPAADMVVDSGPSAHEATKHAEPRTWGAAPEKMALLDASELRHDHSVAWDSVFLGPALDSTAEGPARRAFIAATGYGQSGSQWTPLAGPAVDLVFYTSLLRSRGFDIDFVSDKLENASDRPTKAAILGHLARLARCTEAGDEIVVIFSGHGVDSAYIPLDCPPGNHAGKAILPQDLRAAFLDILPADVAVLVLWDTCYASNPLHLPQQMNLTSQDSLEFRPTEFQNLNGPSVVLMTASSGISKEMSLAKAPNKVQCGLLCWAAWTFIYYHYMEDEKQNSENIMQALIEYTRECCKSRKEVVPQFLCSTQGPKIPERMIKLLNRLYTGYHPLLH